MSQPVLRAQPTAETVDALRSVLDDLHSTVVAESEAERHAQEEPAEEEESMDSAVAMLLEQLGAAEERATYAEQQAIYAGQQAAQQLAAQAASALPQPGIAHDGPEVSTRASSFAIWGGWCAAALATALAAGTYFTSYRPLHEQLAAQTKLIELQALRSSETEAALRRSFDREREAFNEQLNTLREAAAASSAPVAADAPTAHQPAADSGQRAATTKAGKLEARAAKRKAWLAKKAERAAKREAHAGKHKAHAAASANDHESDKSQAAKPKHKAKPAAANTDDESSSNDPLEGL